MSDRGTHEAAAATNVSLAKTLNIAGSEHRVWVPTIIFYAGVQTVDAALADFAEHPRGHDERQSAIHRHWPGPAAADYKVLRDLSMDWRYRGLEPTSADYEKAWRRARNLCAGIGERWPQVGT